MGSAAGELATMALIPLVKKFQHKVSLVLI